MVDNIIDGISKLGLNEEKPVIEEIKDSNKLNNIKEKNIWIPWTDKSKDILFNQSNGEDKVAAELDTHALGQNSPYDMDAIINHNKVKCEIKKLDNNTFNTGVKGRDLLRPIKNTIIDLLNICRKINNSSILTSEENKKISDLKNLSPDELCVSNIQKIKEVCKILSEKQELLRKSLPKVTPFEKKGEPLEMSLDKYYSICVILEQPILPEYESYNDTLIFLHEISHKYISNPSLFMDDLHNLVSVFTELQLIFVDQKKGYCIWDKMECITFERITRGHPRFRVHFQK